MNVCPVTKAEHYWLFEKKGKKRIRRCSYCSYVRKPHIDVNNRT